MTLEAPHVGRANEPDRPDLADIARLVGRSDGALLLAILDTDATRAEIEAAVLFREHGGTDPSASGLDPRAAEVLSLLVREDQSPGPEGPDGASI